MARREAAWPIVATREIMARLTDRYARKKGYHGAGGHL